MRITEDRRGIGFFGVRLLIWSMLAGFAFIVFALMADLDLRFRIVFLLIGSIILVVSAFNIYNHWKIQRRLRQE
jgi:Ca2+/Na+ antiporter